MMRSKLPSSEFGWSGLFGRKQLTRILMWFGCVWTRQGSIGEQAEGHIGIRGRRCGVDRLHR